MSSVICQLSTVNVNLSALRTGRAMFLSSLCAHRQSRCVYRVRFSYKRSRHVRERRFHVETRFGGCLHKRYLIFPRETLTLLPPHRPLQAAIRFVTCGHLSLCLRSYLSILFRSLVKVYNIQASSNECYATYRYPTTWWRRRPERTLGSHRARLVCCRSWFCLWRRIAGEELIKNKA